MYMYIYQSLVSSLCFLPFTFNVYLSIYLLFYLSVCLSIYLSIYLSVYQFIYLSPLCLSVSFLSLFYLYYLCLLSPISVPSYCLFTSQLSPFIQS